MIIRPKRGRRQALTKIDIRKKTNTIPWITLILTLPIIHRKKPRFPHGTILIPNRRSSIWIRIMEPMRTARDLQK
jgi:hypothetical protein